MFLAASQINPEWRTSVATATLTSRLSQATDKVPVNSPASDNIETNLKLIEVPQFFQSEANDSVVSSLFTVNIVSLPV